MTIFTSIEVDGTAFTDAEQIEVKRSTGDYNSSSSFRATFPNQDGIHNTSFSLNDEVVINADLDTNPAVTKLFTGIIENIKFKARGNVRESVEISGRDLIAVLQDIAAKPRVFKDREASLIVIDLLDQNAKGLLTTTNVNTTTTTISQITFNHTPLFDALKQLAELSEFYFFVDEDKDLHFVQSSSLSSGITLNTTNIKKAEFKEIDREIFNDIFVYGSEALTGAKEVFDTLLGSEYVLTDKPHNSRVFVSGTAGGFNLQEIGGVLTFSDPSTTSGLNYVIDFNSKKVIFVSGTNAGDNIPVSGTARNVVVEYERNTQILSRKQDPASQTAFGKKNKVIVDRNIKDFSEASAKSTQILADSKDAILQGNLDIDSLLSLTPGNTVVVNLPNFNISSQTYDILEVNYIFNGRTVESNQVQSVRVNKKISDAADIIKDTLLRLKQVETGAFEGEVLDLQSATGSLGISGTWFAIQGSPPINTFIFHNGFNDIFNSPVSQLGAREFLENGSTIFGSGGF